MVESAVNDASTAMWSLWYEGGRGYENTKALCQTAVVAALYVALTTLNPLSWGVIQFRVANMLCALRSRISGTPGGSAGDCNRKCNESFRPVDVLFGLLAEGTAYALVVWGPWKRLGILWKAVILSCPWLCSSAWNCL